MTNNSLTAANIRYLLVLKRLNNIEGVRGVDIAEELGLSKASVHSMMDSLLTLKIIQREKRGKAVFTEYGASLADKYALYYQKVKRQLFQAGSPDSKADRAICAFLAELSADTLDCL